MFISYLTLVHILISLVGIAAGFGMLSGLLTGKLLPRWTAVFLAFTIATSATGFVFPFTGITPGIIVGVLSLITLGLACYALYLQALAGVWRTVFAIAAVTSLYFNFFVLVAQHFQKVPALAAIAPTPAAPASAITQTIVLVAFIWVGTLATRRFGEQTV